MFARGLHAKGHTNAGNLRNVEFFFLGGGSPALVRRLLTLWSHTGLTYWPVRIRCMLLMTTPSSERSSTRRSGVTGALYSLAGKSRNASASFGSRCITTHSHSYFDQCVSWTLNMLTEVVITPDANITWMVNAARRSTQFFSGKKLLNFLILIIRAEKFVTLFLKKHTQIKISIWYNDYISARAHSFIC